MSIKHILLSLSFSCSCVCLNYAITRQPSCPDLQQEALKKALMATLCLREKKVIHDNFGFLLQPTMHRNHSSPNLLNRGIQDVALHPKKGEDVPNNQKNNQYKGIPTKKVSRVPLNNHLSCNCTFQKDYFEEARAFALSLRKPTPIVETPIIQEAPSAKPSITHAQEKITKNKNDYVDAYKRLNASFGYISQSFVSFDQKRAALQWIQEEAEEWTTKNTPNKRNFVLTYLRANEYLKKLAAVKESMRAIIALEDVD